MIVVDSSVWIANSRGIETPAASALQRLARSEVLLVGDVIMVEVLQGARTEREAIELERALMKFSIVAMLEGRLTAKAAANYRILRRRGVTVRSTIDMIIGTYCIDRGHALLQDDRDFLPMAEHLGLKLA